MTGFCAIQGGVCVPETKIVAEVARHVQIIAVDPIRDTNEPELASNIQQRYGFC